MMDHLKKNRSSPCGTRKRQKAVSFSGNANSLHREWNFAQKMHLLIYAGKQAAVSFRKPALFSPNNNMKKSNGTAPLL